MEWLYLILLILLSIGGFLIGFKYVGIIKSRWWIVIACLSLGVIGLYGVFRFYPAIEYHLIPLFLASLTEIIGYIPFAMLFFGIAAKRVTSRFLPIELMILALLIFIYGLIRVNWIYTDSGIDPDKFLVNHQGICFQSTGYTCGAASAVTLLKSFGIDSIEIEMARLSHTSKDGVSMVQVARAIAYKVRDKGLKVDIITGDWQTLKQITTPCIVNVKWTLLVDHMVVLLKTAGDKVIIADPLRGKETYSKQDFLDKWRGSMLLVNPVRNDAMMPE